MSLPLQFGNLRIDEIRLADVCRRYQVQELSLFGSAARGKIGPDSDLDLLVEFRSNAPIGLLDYALMLDLSELLGRKVDLVSKNRLKCRRRPSILREARLLYAR